jgi:2,5-diamino-6-(ribosylamino)-4(3H)-pyrimidinone 5'-phosphate reductase
MTHYLRSQHDAILIGANTAIVDDPSLNCRHVAVKDLNGDGLQENPEANQQASQPMPIILDPSGRWLPTAESKVLKLAREGKGKGVLWIVVAQADPAAMALVRASGGDVVFLGPRLRSANGNGVNWDAMLAELADRGVGSVMVEGGAKVIMDLLRKENQRFVSSVVITVAPVWLGTGGVGVFPPRGKGEGDVEREVGRLERVRWVPMGEDVVMAGRFTGGDR